MGQRVIGVLARSFLIAGTVMLASCASTGSTTTSNRPGEAARTVTSVERSALREQAIELLIRDAQSDQPQLRANAIEGLLQAPARAEPLIALGLKDENLGVRSVAAMAAGRAQMRSLAAAVRPLLSDESPFVRASAVYALTRLGDAPNPQPLADLLLTDPSPRVRAHAAFILGELKNRSATGMLRQAVLDKLSRSSPAEVRLLQLQIAEALVKLGDEQQVQTIRAALFPSRPEELEAAALAIQIIGEIKDRGAIDQLIYLASYKDEAGQPMPAEIRLAIASALAKMDVREGAFLAREYQASPIPAVRAQAASVYGETGQDANLIPLAEMMNDPEGIVRVAAAAATVKITRR